MKKIVLTFLLSLVLGVFFVSQNAFAQSFSGDSFAKAVTDGRNGAVIQWKAQPDIKNIGFIVYRMDGKQMVPVNGELVPGVALGGFRPKVEGEFDYSIFDPNGSQGSVYVIEAINAEGGIERFEVGSVFSEDISALRDSIAGQFDEAANTQNENDAINEFPTPPDDKLFASLNEEPQQNQTTQQWVAAQPGAKIAVKAEGMYRVTRAQLSAAGFDVNAPVANWQLYTDGVEQAINVAANGDFIEFYGRQVDNLYSGTKIYYLVVGNGAGRRMAVGGRRINATRITSQNFSNNVLLKPRAFPELVYSGVILNGEEENFFARSITNASTATFQLVIKGIDRTQANTVIQIRLQGLTLVSHSQQVFLNGTSIGSITGSDRNLMVKDFTVPTSVLLEGANTLGLRSAASGDISLFHSATVSFARRYEADANRLKFTTNYGRATTVSGFTSSGIRVFDVTDPNNTAIVNARIENNSATIGASRPLMLYALTDDALLTPSAVTANSPSTILTSAAGKDLVIISHSNFLALSETLATYRRTQNLTVAVVNVEDVFDESGYGQESPYSISAFLQATNPKYALLVGDGTLDPKGYYTPPPFSNAFANFVPTRIVDTLFGEVSADDLMGDFNNDAIPEIPVGRLPVSTTTALQNIINKIQAFEANVSVALMLKGAIFVNDNPDGWDFYESNLRVRNELPAGMPSKFIKRSDFNGDVTQIRNAITADINTGRFMVVYSGHGQISGWGNSPNFYSSADVPNLTNTDYGLFLPSNCLNGAFADIFGESLGEVILESQKGAVASWASSGLTFPDSQEQMAIRFFRAIGTREFARIGDAIKVSKGATQDRDVRTTWNYLGDPTLKVR